MEASTRTKTDATVPLEPAREPSPMYRTAMTVCKPVALWGRMQAEGVEVLPERGPVLVVGNHDSHWDPVMVGISAIRRRQIKALAKAELWDVRGLAPVLEGMGQIPIQRESGDAGALARAIEELRRGACIGVFPEGTRSRGKVLRARSGVGRLALEVPEAKLVCGFASSSRPVGRLSPERRRESSRSGCWPRSARSSRRRSPPASALDFWCGRRGLAGAPLGEFMSHARFARLAPNEERGLRPRIHRNAFPPPAAIFPQRRTRQPLSKHPNHPRGPLAQSVYSARSFQASA
jgi:1-acyl-sn-glycerol-3-phosphate acyltransferase